MDNTSTMIFNRENNGGSIVDLVKRTGVGFELVKMVSSLIMNVINVRVSVSARGP